MTRPVFISAALTLVGVSALAGFQGLSGSAEWVGRQNLVNANGLGADAVHDLQAAVMLRGRARSETRSGALSANFQAYGGVSGYGARKVHVDEAWASFDLHGRFSLLGGIQRYPDQYSHYWNPTFPIRAKTDLFRPDYLAAGTPMIVASAKLGGLTPKFITAWEGDDTWYGVQINGYSHTVEGYVNGFWSHDHERTAGAGFRASTGGWTLHGEAAAVWFMWRPHAYRFSAGTNRVLLKKGFLTLEAYHDGTGLSSAELQQLPRIVASHGTPALPGELRRNYSFAGYHHAHNQRWKWGVRNVVCWDDRSGFLQPMLTWIPGEHIELGIDVFANYASGSSAFGRFPVRSSVSMRFRYYR